MSSVHSPGATSARQTKTKTTQGKNLSSMTSVFFLTTSQRKIAPSQTNRCTSCVLFPNWASGYFHPRFAQRSLIPSPAPPPPKKKNYLSANVVLTQLVRCYFFVPPKEKGKKQRKNKRAKVLNEACIPISGSSPSGAGGWSANNCCKEVSAYFWNSHQVSRINIMWTTVRGKSRSLYFNCEIIILKEQHLPQ